MFKFTRNQRNVNLSNKISYVVIKLEKIQNKNIEF